MIKKIETGFNINLLIDYEKEEIIINNLINQDKIKIKGLQKNDK